MNVLTGPTDSHWRAVRKGVSPAFSASRMKEAFHTFSRCASQLATILSRTAAPINIDNLVLRSSMDVIGHIGFAKRMGTLASLDDYCSEDQADTMICASHEVRWQLASWEDQGAICSLKAMFGRQAPLQSNSGCLAEGQALKACLQSCTRTVMQAHLQTGMMRQVVKRIYEPYRAIRLWRLDVRAGRRLLRRFRVSTPWLAPALTCTDDAMLREGLQLMCAWAASLNCGRCPCICMTLPEPA